MLWILRKARRETTSVPRYLNGRPFSFGLTCWGIPATCHLFHVEIADRSSSCLGAWTFPGRYPSKKRHLATVAVTLEGSCGTVSRSGVGCVLVASHYRRVSGEPNEGFVVLMAGKLIFAAVAGQGLKEPQDGTAFTRFSSG